MEGYGVYYTQEDGWLDDYLPVSYPEVGTFVNMNFKVIGKGVLGYWKSLVQLRVDANGEVYAKVIKDELVCH